MIESYNPRPAVVGPPVFRGVPIPKSFIKATKHCSKGHRLEHAIRQAKTGTGAMLEPPVPHHSIASRGLERQMLSTITATNVGIQTYPAGHTNNLRRSCMPQIASVLLFSYTSELQYIPPPPQKIKSKKNAPLICLKRRKSPLPSLSPFNHYSHILERCPFPTHPPPQKEGKGFLWWMEKLVEGKGGRMKRHVPHPVFEEMLLVKRPRKIWWGGFTFLMWVLD